MNESIERYKEPKSALELYKERCNTEMSNEDYIIEGLRRGLSFGYITAVYGIHYTEVEATVINGYLASKRPDLFETEESEA